MIDSIIIAVIRSLISVVVMASTSFVLGSVVAYQYHDMIFEFSRNKDIKKKHRSLVRFWYKWGFVTAFIILLLSEICLYFKGINIERGYLLVLLSLVISFWGIWLYQARRDIKNIIMNQKKPDVLWEDVYWEFYVSCCSLIFASAFSGIAIVKVIFEWVKWIAK